MEAALSRLQFPQQDADNIEKKPKVYLEIECGKVKGKSQEWTGGLGRGLWGIRNPKSFQHRDVQEEGCVQIIALELVCWRLGAPHGAQGLTVPLLLQPWNKVGVRPCHPASSTSQGLL